MSPKQPTVVQFLPPADVVFTCSLFQMRGKTIATTLVDNVLAVLSQDSLHPLTPGTAMFAAVSQAHPLPSIPHARRQIY